MMMRPDSIEQFERFFLAALATGIINSVVSYSSSIRLLETDPAMVEAGFGPGFYVWVLIFAFGIPILLWYFVARRASNVAKWILVVMTVLGLLSMAMTLPVIMQRETLSLVLTAVTSVLQLISLSFLFRRDAVEWLSSAGQKGPVDPTTFD